MAKQEPNIAAILPAQAADLVIQERHTSSPGPGEILVRNSAIAVNPVDWKRQTWGFMIPSYPSILGADIAGVIIEVGPSVTGFKPGDRILGFGDSFASGNADHAAFQTYTIVGAASVAVIPKEMSFKQAATLPTAVAASAMALFDVLDLPFAIHQKEAILIWGGASSVGHAAIQIARLAGLTIFAVASERHHAALRKLGASVLVDYHSPSAVDDLVAAAQHAGTRIRYALDTVSTAETLRPVVEVLTRLGGGVGKKIAHLTPWAQDVALPEGIGEEQVGAEHIWGRRKDIGEWLFNDTLPKWLERGDVVPSRHRVIEGGLFGLQTALNELKQGVSGEKLVVEV